MVYAEVAAGRTPPNDTPQTVPTQPNGATGSYSVHTDDDVTWHVAATGIARGVTRTVSAYVTPAQTVTTQQLAIWNYLYEDSNNNSSVSGGAVINMPILTGGDFGIAGGAKILGNLEVGGNLSTSGASTTIGTASSPISLLEILNVTNSGCSILGHATAPGVGTCDGLHTGAYAKPCRIDARHDPGNADGRLRRRLQRVHDALSKTGCPALLFDKNAHHMNNDNSANIGALMFGSTDYDCFVGTSELKWNHTTKRLTRTGSSSSTGR